MKPGNFPERKRQRHDEEGQTLGDILASALRDDTPTPRVNEVWVDKSTGRFKRTILLVHNNFVVYSMMNSGLVHTLPINDFMFDYKVKPRTQKIWVTMDYLGVCRTYKGKPRKIGNRTVSCVEMQLPY